ncbi:MAG: helix-turn-helix transcriptional regulator [Ruminiclostridium sp.]|nr:helix-turn-helix transcriptional regulator [Ruminiclostridium sp.]
MSNLYNKIENLCNQANITITQLCKELNISRSSLSELNAGRTKQLSVAVMRKISEYFNVSVDWLAGSTEPRSETAPDMADDMWLERKLNKMGYRIIITEAHEEEYIFLEYPDGTLEISPKDLDSIEDNITDYLGFIMYELKKKRAKNFRPKKPITPTIRIKHSVYKASAGFGFDLEDRDEWDEIDIPDTPEAQEADFAVTIYGNSMEPIYSDGDIVLVKAYEEINIGETGIFVVNGQGYIKQYGGDRLISVNSDYDDIVFTEGDYIKCAGKVIGIA